MLEALAKAHSLLLAFMMLAAVTLPVSLWWFSRKR